MMNEANNFCLIPSTNVMVLRMHSLTRTACPMHTRASYQCPQPLTTDANTAVIRGSKTQPIPVCIASRLSRSHSVPQIDGCCGELKLAQASPSWWMSQLCIGEPGHVENLTVKAVLLMPIKDWSSTSVRSESVATMFSASHSNEPTAPCEAPDSVHERGSLSNPKMVIVEKVTDPS